MDVRCDSCQTVYEFDESRVKEGGVTVKCTQCGHIFKVRKRPAAAVAAKPRTIPGMAPLDGGSVPAPLPPSPSGPARAQAPPPAAADPAGGNDQKLWLLKSGTTGEVRRFRDLTTLQQWIVEKKAFKDDEISRTGDRWTRIGGIAELAPFFRVVEQADGRGPAKASPPAAFLPTQPQRVTPQPDQAMQALAAGPSSSAARADLPTPPAFSPETPSPFSSPNLRPPSMRITSDDDHFDTIPRRRMMSPSVVLGVASVLAIGGVAGYLLVFKRPALTRLVASDDGGRGREACKKGREDFMLDTDEDFHRADQQLQRAQGADDANPRPIAALAEVNVTWARWLRDDARQVERTHPTRAEELRREAQTHADDARRYANEAKTLSPADPDVNRAMADFLTLDGAPASQVEESLRRSEARRPDDPELRYVRGALLLRDGKLDEAKALLEEANRLNQAKTQHDLLRADYLLASIAVAHGRADEARVIAHRILETNPHHHRASALIAALDTPPVAAQDAGLAASALAAVALPASPANPAAPANAATPATAVLAAGPAPALTTPAPAAVASPLPPGTPAPAANPTTKPGDPATAATTATTAPTAAPRSDPHGYGALVSAGDKLLERGKGKDAIKLFEKALAEQPGGVEALNGLAYAYLDTEHFNAAADKFREVLASVPNNGDAIIGLAETYKSRGDKTRALEFYQKYLSELPGGSKAAMAQQNVTDLKAEAGKVVRPTASEFHDAPPLPAPPPTDNPPP